MSRAFATAFLACSVVSAGCSSITGSTMQNFSLQALDKDAREVKGAACEMSNSKGKWFVSSPGSTTISRSNDNLNVVCQKDGMEPGRAAVVSATKGSMFGNIIFGGGIGAIIDHSNGSAYEYPNFVQVMMGLFKTIEQLPNGGAETAAAPK
jgi:hypothetical protein